MLGFLGSAHCLGMCGGLASALGLNTPARHSTTIASSTDGTAKTPSRFLLTYNLGRILSYCIAGLIVGTMGFWLSQQLSALAVLRYLAGSMLILMGLYLGQWFNGILWTEKLGSILWPYIHPLSKRFIPIGSLKDALLVGLVWGWLPCGLVYSALIWASLEASLLGSALIMLAFGLGTLPSMLASGIFAKRIASLLRQKAFRASAGILMVCFGLWTMPFIHRHIVSLLG